MDGVTITRRNSGTNERETNMAAKQKKKEAEQQPEPQPGQENPQPPQQGAPESAQRMGRKMPDLPGMVGDGVAKPDVPALDEAVLDYVKERDKRIEHGVKEKTNKKLILALMDKHALGSYSVDDMVVVRKPKDETASIKVMAAADYTGDPSAPEADEDE